MFQPPWLTHAWAELGTHEAAGPETNPRVVTYFTDAGHPEIRDDATAWCAAFVGAMLTRAGVPSTQSLLARSYQSWGAAPDTPRLGAIAVLFGDGDPQSGHVGFLIGETPDHLILLGGNQSNAVSVAAFHRDRLVALRWPLEKPSAAIPTPAIFDAALAHVLAMEGGWTNDPDDSGGPTNLGITLADYGAFRKTALTADTTGPLMSELRSLSRDTAREIYATKYWSPAHCSDLPGALALMHFDAAVNHGITTAARLLQQALAVTIDGEIGRETIAATRTEPAAEVLDRYADLRRSRYRSLAQFPHFGRGWLARVDATLAAARKQLPPLQPPAKKENPVPDSETTHSAQTTPPSPKWWGDSMTIWGTLITAAATVLPVVGPLIGIDLTPDLIKQLGANVIQAVQAIAGLAGTIMAIIGRARAVQPLVRREVRLML